MNRRKFIWDMDRLGPKGYPQALYFAWPNGRLMNCGIFSDALPTSEWPEKDRPPYAIILLDKIPSESKRAKLEEWINTDVDGAIKDKAFVAVCIVSN